MSPTLAHEFAAEVAPLQHWRERLARRGGRNALRVFLAAVAITTPVYGQDSAGNGGYYGESYDPGDAAAASATVVPEQIAPAGQPPREPLVPAQDSWTGFGSLYYQPGFQGCSPGAIQSIGTSSGLRTGLVSLPLAPAQERGRYLRIGLSAAQIYTDNVTLASDENAESDFITQVVPSLEACASSGRIRGSLNYQLQALRYQNNSQFNDIYHNIAGETTIEILPGHFFLAADSSYGQSVIDPSSSYSQTNALRPGNRTSAWITNVSPYWVQGLGPVGLATLRYRYGRAVYGDSDVSDYTLHGVSLNISSRPQPIPWSWQANAFTQRVERDDVDRDAFDGDPDDFPQDDDVSDSDLRTTRFDQATLQLGYQLTETLQLLALGGLENEYQPDGSVDRLGSAMWNVGFRWASQRNSLEARYGERSFGSTYSVRATHRAPAFDVSLDYQEDTTTSGLNQLNGGGFGSAGAFPQPVMSLRDRGVFVQKRLLASLGFDTAFTRTTVQAFDETREYLSSFPDEHIYGGDVQVNYSAGPRTSVVPRLGWQHRESGQEEEADIAEAGVSLVYLITPTAQGALGYSHSWRDAETEADSYEENRVVVQFSVYY